MFSVAKAIKYLLLLLLLGLLLAWLFMQSVSWGLFGKLPGEEELKAIRNHTASEVYSSDSVLLGRYYLENRSNVAFNNVPPHLVQALLATEDVRFYSHKGVDRISLFRVLFKSILFADESSGGGSTISQQLAKNLFGRRRYGILTMPVNKAKEIITASRIENVYNKDEILLMYLNTVSFGENTFGIQTAAELFYSTSPEDLDVQQSAMLVGLLKAPSLYHPRKHPSAALKRRNTVLQQMEKYKYISSANSRALQQMPLGLNYRRDGHSSGIAPYFREHLRLRMLEWLKDYNKKHNTNYNLYTDGLKIYTTIHSRLQGYAEKAVAEHLAKLQSELKKYKSAGKYQQDKDIMQMLITSSDRYRKGIKAGIKEKELVKSFDEKVPVTLWDWQGEREATMSPKDSLLYYLRFLNSGFCCTNPATGEVLAWVGGINHSLFKYDHVTSRRQVGSVIKPLVYLTALENGRNPCDLIRNEHYVFAEFKGWSPANADGKYGGYYSMKGALANSLNSVSAKLISETGIRPVREKIKKMGVEAAIPYAPSIALGAVDISLREMLGAYSCFVNMGAVTEPYFIQKVCNAKGRTLFFKKPSATVKKRVADKDDARMINLMMQQVVNSGTAASLRSLYRLRFPIAGKTGTTQNGADGWFVGATPHLLAGCWVGGEYPFVRFPTSALGQGSKMALPVWALFMQQVQDDEQLAWMLKGKFDTGVVAQANLNCPDFKEETVFEKWLGTDERKADKRTLKERFTEMREKRKRKE